jgi:hypothetical protein
MFNPLKWKQIDQARLLIATAFGALLGFTNGSGNVWFNLLWTLVGAVFIGGAFYCFRAFR